MPNFIEIRQQFWKL